MGNIKLFGGVSPFENADHSYRLGQISTWLRSRRGRPPSPPPAEPEDDEGQQEHQSNMGWHPRGLFNPTDRDWVINAMWNYGLDVILEIPALPIPWGKEQREVYLTNIYSPFWTHDDWNLIKINIHPGPLWIDFVASDFDIGDNHYHISLCYRNELWDWWDFQARQLVAMDAWIHQYRKMRKRYHGKRAR